MFERSHLEELAAFEGTGPVVSLYLNLPPRLRGTPEAYRARLRGLLKEAAGAASEADITAIETFFEKSFDWMGRSAAVFSSAADGFWHVQTFAVPLRSSVVFVGDKPFLTPLLNMFDTYGSYSVALVDQQAMRLLHVHLGELVATRRVEGEEVKRLKAGGGAPGRGRGDDVSGSSQAAIRGNLKEFAEALGVFARQHRTEHILLGGSEPTVSAFKELLGQPWRSCVEETFNISMRATDREVLDHSLGVMLSRVEAHEAQLAETVQMLAAKGANGVLGPEETLAAVDAGRVQTLLVVEGALPAEVTAPAIARVVDYGGEVEFVGENSPLREHGGIAALLRY